MSTALDILHLIAEYENEREPDITLSCEFKNGIRVAPTIEQHHSVTDFKQWLNQKIRR